MANQSKPPHPVDRQVGANLRRLRRAAGLSQTKLGNGIGITFQQIQKYERAYNRVSASRLYDLAEHLSAVTGRLVPLMDFFEGCEAAPAGPPRHDPAAAPEAEVAAE